MSAPERSLRTGEVAALLGVSPSTVRSWARAGRLPIVETFGGHWRYPASGVGELTPQFPPARQPPVRATYARTRNGQVVHLASCPHAVTGVPWPWADGHTRAQLAELARSDGWRLCAACLPAPPPPTDLLTTAEVARLLGCSTRTVNYHAAVGTLASVRTPGGHRRFAAAAVGEVLRRREQGDQP